MTKGLRVREDPEPARIAGAAILADRPDNYLWLTLCGWEIRSPLADSVLD
jgi:hypothetical protein